MPLPPLPLVTYSVFPAIVSPRNLLSLPGLSAGYCRHKTKQRFSVIHRTPFQLAAGKPKSRAIARSAGQGSSEDAVLGTAEADAGLLARAGLGARSPAPNSDWALEVS